ncbi:MAG: phage tail sheath family protein [Bacteroidetes bacterium]|nr:phage tail sheath family protein [Bacteroidota bacterium]
MATTFNTPGVYIQEISTLPPSIAPVSTAIPAFIGYTAAGTANSPVRITSMIEYVANFGGPYLETFDITIVDTPATVPITSRVISSAFNGGPKSFNLFQSMQLYFGNGGGPCYVVSSGIYPNSLSYATDIKNALDALEKVDEPTLILSPDMIGSGLSGSYGTFLNDVLIQCAKLQDRFGVFDNPVDDVTTAALTTYRGIFGSNNLKYGASYMPFLKTGLPFGINEVTSTIPSANYNGNDPSVLAVVNKPLNDGSATSVKALNFSLYQQIISNINNSHLLTLPPSGAMVGIYASVDNDRGVWKAPANVSVNLVNSPTIAITEEQQGGMNVDSSSGKSINAIRSFTGRGILVWGSRTLAGNDNEWRYVPVRRLFIFAEESIKKASEFVVFEPNDKNTWLRVKSMISNFLTDLWRQGALAGDKPEQAFFVKVGLGETMTAQDILEGKLIIQVGMAAVRPAEFIILQFMHKLQEA